MKKKQSKLDELKDVAWETRHAHRDLLEERRKKRDAAVDAYAKQVDAQLEAEYGERIARLNQGACDAEQAVTDEKNRLAREEPVAPYPPGTRVAEWLVRGYHAWRNLPPDQWKPTGKVGVIEVWTSDSLRPANKQCTPEIGQWVIRILDKKGQPTKKWVRRWGDDWPHNWAPEGERPKVQK